MTTTALILALLFAALSFADAWLTLALLKRPGNREGNPLLARLFARFGPAPVLYVGKLAIVVALAVILWLDVPYARVAALLLIVATAWAVWSNWRRYRR